MAETKKEKTINEKLIYIQQKLKSPKDLVNKFGGYSYRSTESILQNAKPLLEEMGLSITLDDDIVQIGERFYVKATATITDGEKSISTHAFAREQIEKKGMDDAQVTGSCSSYARKYALNGLLAIDDTRDADTMDNTKEGMKTAPKKEIRKATTEVPNKNLSENIVDVASALGINLENVAKYLKKSVSNLTDEDLRKCIEQKVKAIKGGNL